MKCYRIISSDKIINGRNFCEALQEIGENLNLDFLNRIEYINNHLGENFYQNFKNFDTNLFNSTDEYKCFLIILILLNTGIIISIEQ
jgi:hypothetical protein